MSLFEVKKLAILTYKCFTDPGNRHFPEKRQNCVKYSILSKTRCKVCRKKAANNETKADTNEKSMVHKTKYRCKGCFVKLQRNINLCITPCFEEFHLHPDLYLMRNRR
jgi:hypothetical protein